MPAPDALAWARRQLPGIEEAGAAPLPPCGSARALTRLRAGSGSVVLVENSLPAGAAVNENDSFVYVAGHLAARGVPVPAVLGYERGRGWMLVEDLGDEDLFQKVRAQKGQAHPHPALSPRGRGMPSPLSPRGRGMPVLPHPRGRGISSPPSLEGRGAGEGGTIVAHYREALEILLRLQVRGAEGFDPARTHNPPYDRAFMLEAESGYFRRAFLGTHLGLAPPPGLDAELGALADAAAAAAPPLLLHRDYQSQNLKLRDGRLFVIDFQGARPGPPQYDVAALLLDPYARLPRGLREELLGHYLDAYCRATGADRGSFLAPFPAVAAHRLMQALGAYAFLGHRRGKTAFLAHIPAALALLGETLDGLPAGACPVLRRTVDSAARPRV